MPIVRYLLPAAAVLSSTALTTAAQDVLLEPFSSTNRNPFIQIYGLPQARSAHLLTVDAMAMDLQLEASNSFTEARRGSERILVDGETSRANLQLRKGLNENVEVGLNIPYLHHDGGTLDGFIEGWHELFGFPDGDRPDYPRDRLQYAYWRDGEQLIKVDNAGSGIGDISLDAGYSLARTASRQWTLRTQLKLPTGDAGKLLGSESTDVAMALHVSDNSWLQHYGVALHGSLGALWMSDGEVLDAQREDWAIYGSATLAWRATDAVSLKLQLDGHSAFYDSRLTELGADSAQLLLGGAIRLSRNWVVDLAVSEDIAVDTAPDVVFHIAIRSAAF